MRNLHKIAHSSYNYLNATVPILQSMQSNDFLHSNRMTRHIPKSENTFNGYMSCGAVSYMLHYYLEINNIKSKMLKTTIGRGRSLEDHVYLLTEDDHIVDATYRQIFDNSNSVYDSFATNLYIKNPFIFVGKFNDLEKFNEDINKLNVYCYGEDSIKNNISFWKDSDDITEKCDLENVVESEIYAQEKGLPFLRLHYFLNNKNPPPEFSVSLIPGDNYDNGEEYQMIANA